MGCGASKPGVNEVSISRGVIQDAALKNASDAVANLPTNIKDVQAIAGGYVPNLQTNTKDVQAVAGGDLGAAQNLIETVAGEKAGGLFKEGLEFGQVILSGNVTDAIKEGCEFFEEATGIDTDAVQKLAEKGENMIAVVQSGNVTNVIQGAGSLAASTAGVEEKFEKYFGYLR